MLLWFLEWAEWHTHVKHSINIFVLVAHLSLGANPCSNVTFSMRPTVMMVLKKASQHILQTAALLPTPLFCPLHLALSNGLWWISLFICYVYLLSVCAYWMNKYVNLSGQALLKGWIWSTQNSFWQTLVEWLNIY